MIPGQSTLAGLRLANRYSVSLRKTTQCLACSAVKHSSPGNDHRALGGHDRAHRSSQFALAWRQRTKLKDRILEEFNGIFESLSLHILGQGKGDRAAESWVGQGAYCTRKGCYQLRGVNDPSVIA